MFNYVYSISVLLNFVQQIIEESWGSSNVRVEHLTTFHFKE